MASKKYKITDIDGNQKEVNLTDKQHSLCLEFMKDHNGKQAAIRAGYSKRTASSIASENLTKPDVILFLDHLRREHYLKNISTINEIVSHLSDMARFDIADAYNENGTPKLLHEIPLATRMMIIDIETYTEKSKSGKNVKIERVTHRIKWSKRTDVQEKLMKYLGAYEKDNKQKGFTAFADLKVGFGSPGEFE